MATEDIAKESYLFWRSVGYNHEEAIAWLAMEAGETSFRQGVVGDHGHAFGPFQHQWARIHLMSLTPPAGCGINIKDWWLGGKPEAHLMCLKATDWETSKGAYKRIKPQLQAAPTPEEKVALLVRKFEQSANQDRDVERRMALYNYWDRVATERGWEWP